MSRVAILGHTFVPGDAVGQDILQMQRVLSAQGHHVKVFANYGEWSEPRCRSLGELRRFLQGDPVAVLLYHHAIGWEEGVARVCQARCRRVVRYHNVTPAEFYEGINDEYVQNCRLGRAQLRRLARAGCDLYLSDSEYNQAELVAEGADPARCRVVPPFHAIDRLGELAADPEVLDACRDGRVNVLFVGRVAPNKGHAALIDAFAVFHRHYDPRSRLVLVGKDDPRLTAHADRLRAQVRRLGIAHAVVFTGEVTDAALKAYYQSADVFLSASEHEGFCVPLVEAMAMRLPIVAYGSSAIPGTLGEAGLVWEKADPFLLAESVACIVAEPAVREALGRRAWERYQECFTTARIAEAFLQAWHDLGLDDRLRVPA